MKITDFDAYINLHIHYAITKGSDTIKPDRDLQKIIDALLRKAPKVGVHVLVKEPTIYLARMKRTSNALDANQTKYS